MGVFCWWVVCAVVLAVFTPVSVFVLPLSLHLAPWLRGTVWLNSPWVCGSQPWGGRHGHSGIHTCPEDAEGGAKSPAQGCCCPMPTRRTGHQQPDPLFAVWTWRPWLQEERVKEEPGRNVLDSRGVLEGHACGPIPSVLIPLRDGRGPWCACSPMH